MTAATVYGFMVVDIVNGKPELLTGLIPTRYEADDTQALWQRVKPADAALIRVAVLSEA